jgi:acyl-CoA thioester hydrolase
MKDDPGSDLGNWPISVSIPVLWGHMDAFSHVNNVMYLRWFESARIAYFEAAGVIAEMERSQIGPILARATCDFKIPLVYPDQVTVQSTVSRIGTTSFTMLNRILSEAHGGAVAAEGEAIIVMVDYAKGEKAPVPDHVRDGIARVESL